MKRLLTLLLLIPLAAFADDDASDAYTLSVKPLLCIVDARTPACEIRFAIRWASIESGYYCVFNELETQALRCWSEAQAGDLRDDRTVAESFSYWLNQGVDEPVLAKATVDVLQKDSDDRRRRRRTRHVWDIL
jgi:hypothetical protein